MKPNILEDLLQHELRSLYSTEKQMFKVLTKMAQAACHSKLRELFMARVKKSGEQARRLERMAGLLGKGLEGSRCQGMRQLIEDEARESLLNAHARNETYDAALIAAASHFICYEIERYELAKMLASRLGLDEAELLIRENLKEQKTLAARLSRLSKSLMNKRAANAAGPGGAASGHQDTFIAAMHLINRSTLSSSVP